MSLEKLTPLGLLLRSLNNATNELDEAKDSMAAALEAVGNVDDADPVVAAEIESVASAARSLALKLDRLNTAVERQYPEPLDPETIGDMRYHAAKDEGRLP